MNEKIEKHEITISFSFLPSAHVYTTKWTAKWRIIMANRNYCHGEGKGKIINEVKGVFLVYLNIDFNP